MSHRLKYKDTSGQCLIIIIHNYKHYKFLRAEKRIKFYKLRSNEALEEATLATAEIATKTTHISSPESVSMSMNPGPKPS